MTRHADSFNAVVRGLVAAAVGTAAMDALLFARYRRGGGETRFADWEFSAGLDSWEDAPAPAHVGKRLVEGLFADRASPQRARLVNNVTHWAFGIANGAAYGLVAGSLPTVTASATGCRSAPPSGRTGTSCCPRRSCTSRSGSTTSRRSATT